MAAFNRNDFDEQDAFSITEIESTGEAGEHTETIPLQPGTAAVAIAVQGGPAEFLAQVDGKPLDKLDLPTPQFSPDGKGSVYVRLTEGAKELKLRIVTHGGKVRIKVLRVLEKFRKDSYKRIRCTACKRLISFLIFSILTGFGFPDISPDSETLKAFWAWLQELLKGNPEKWPEFITKLLAILGGPFVDALRWIVGLLNEALQPLDRMYEAVCRRLGLCP